MRLNPHWGIIIEPIQWALQPSQRRNIASSFLIETNPPSPAADNFNNKPVGFMQAERANLTRGGGPAVCGVK
jgi:hypothetical protein